MELGQMLSSNTPVQNYEAYWATDGLHLIAQVIAELRGENPNGAWTTLTTNSGAEEYVNDVFEMRCYCWCDAGWDMDERENNNHPHSNGCPPNFVYKPTGLTMSWYKYAKRGVTSNKKYPGARIWFEIIKHCIGSIE